jgi:hypothetical protein
MPRRPARPSAAHATEVARLLRLWRRPDFQRANLALLEEAYPLILRLRGTPGPEWDAFRESRVVPFAQQWQAWPAIHVELLLGPDRAETFLDLLAGRWGVVPIFPETTETDIRRAARRIRTRIGKRHRDAQTLSRAVLSRWLEDNGIPRRAIPQLLGWREGGADRPSAAAAVAARSFEDEAALMHRLWPAGVSHRAADRRVRRRLRGTEAPAARMVRKAQAQYAAWRHQLEAALTAPRAADPVSAALTRLLRARYLTRDPVAFGRAFEALWPALRPSRRRRATRTGRDRGHNIRQGSVRGDGGARAPLKLPTFGADHPPGPPL